MTDVSLTGPQTCAPFDILEGRLYHRLHQKCCYKALKTTQEVGTVRELEQDHKMFVINQVNQNLINSKLTTFSQINVHASQPKYGNLLALALVITVSKPIETQLIQLTSNLVKDSAILYRMLQFSTTTCILLSAQLPTSVSSIQFCELNLKFSPFYSSPLHYCFI